MGVEGQIFLGVVRRRGRGGGVIFIEYNEIMENKKFGRTILVSRFLSKFMLLNAANRHGSIFYIKRYFHN